MRTDSELETLLRDTFAGRAGTVHAGPQWALPTRHRHRVWPLVLAAAAAVVLVTLGVTLIPESPGTQHQPATEHTAPKPSSTRSVPAPRTTTHAPETTVCTTRLPGAWASAVANSRYVVGGIAATVDDVGSDGTLVVSRDDGVTPGSAREILLIKPGQYVNLVYPVARPDADTATAVLVGHSLIVAVETHPRPPKGTIPNTPPAEIRQLIAIDPHTGKTQHTIVTLPSSDSGDVSGPVIDTMAVINGQVYWDRRASYSATSGVINSYDPASGSTRTVYSGPLDTPLSATAAGLGSAGAMPQLFVKATLPPVVAAGMDPAHPLFVYTDGTTWAWVKSAHEIGWWTPGQSKAVYVRTQQALDLDNGPGGFAVSGPFVFSLQPSTVIDMRTGAQAALTGHGLTSGKFATFEPTLAHNGVLYGVEYTGTGHYVDGYWQDAQPQIQRVDTTRLPGLSC